MAQPGKTRVSREVVIPTPSLIASAVRYPGKAPRIHNAGNQAWQRDCYRHYAICGEARAAARFMGRASLAPPSASPEGDRGPRLSRTAQHTNS